MIDQVSDAVPLIAKFKDSIYSFALFGMTVQQKDYLGGVVSAIVVGVMSALAVSYVNAEKNSVKLDNFIAFQTRQMEEMKADLRVHGAEVRALVVKQAYTDAEIRSQYGMNGKK